MTHIEPYLVKYPFLNQAKEVVEQFDQSRIFADPVIERAKDRIVNGINNGVTGPIPNNNTGDILNKEEFEDHEIELLSYPTARILVSLIGDFRIINQYSRAEASTAIKRMIVYDFKQEQTSDSSEEILEIEKETASQFTISIEDILEEYSIHAEETTQKQEFHRTFTSEAVTEFTESEIESISKEVFDINGDKIDELNENPTNTELYQWFNSNTHKKTINTQLYKITIDSYLQASSSLNNDYWRLKNRGLKNGNVVITRGELEALIKEVIFNHISEKLPLEIPEEIKEELQEHVPKIEEQIDDSNFSYEIDRVEEGLFPPVIKKMIADFPTQLKHEQKVTLAAFCVHIGMNVEEILEFLGVKGTPGESPTRYQVKHISTGGGSGEPYTPANYTTIESWGYEWDKDALEQSVKNPLTYYKIKLQDTEEDKNQSEGENTEDENKDEAPSDPNKTEEIPVDAEQLQTDAENL